MSTLDPARIAHATAGRMRLKVRSRLGDRDYFDSVRRELLKCEQVEQVEANPWTGSIVVWHRGPADIGSIASHAKSHGLFRIDARGWTLADAAVEFYREIDEEFSKLIVGRVDLQSAVLVLLVLAGFLQLARGQVLMPAASMFWYAFETLRSRAQYGDGGPLRVRPLHERSVWAHDAMEGNGDEPGNGPGA
jgi:hypothetical protein